jgi:hypothetical protein
MNLASTLHGGQSRLLLLAPSSAYIPQAFAEVAYNPEYHAMLLEGLQRLRGQIYFEDGAIHRGELETDGRYVQSADERAWHLVSIGKRGEVRGCARYLAHSGKLNFYETGLANSPLTHSSEWGATFQAAVESEIKLANRLGIDYVEVGGWALTPEVRCTSEALRIALGMFSLARLLGGCVGIATATKRHCSSSILRRIGGRTLTEAGIQIPGYFDPHYDCEMEILRFDSARPNPRFEAWIEELTRHLSGVPVIQGSAPADLWRHEMPAMSAA